MARKKKEMDKLRFIMRVINRITFLQGKIVAFWIFLIMVIIFFEVVSRYFFNKPTTWVDETSRFLFTMYFLLGGSYTFFLGGHIRVEAIYMHLSARLKAILDLGTGLIFFFFMAILIWEGWEIFWRSLINMERTESSWAPLTFPMKMALPIGCFLVLLQGMLKFIQDLITAVIGREVSGNLLGEK
jgi:TRAP-type mannitol/chloroaromatic compound transport system permease small subunit